MLKISRTGELPDTTEKDSTESDYSGPPRIVLSNLNSPDVATWRRSLDQVVMSGVDPLVRFSLSYWPLLLSLASGLVVLGAYLSPALLRLGYSDAGRALFDLYSYICAQTPAHSFYPWGYQAAIDQRLTALYGAVAVSGLLYYRFGSIRRPLSWRAYLLLSLPIALDGFTQLFGWRHSIWELRILTGAVFGVATVWLLYPRLDRALTHTELSRAQNDEV